jgi:hypothetical protein
MDQHVNRRDFLKRASAASAALASAGALADTIAKAAPPARPKITDGGYTPIADYPIAATRFSDVAIEDAFWKPKIDTRRSPFRSKFRSWSAPEAASRATYSKQRCCR